MMRRSSRYRVSPLASIAMLAASVLAFGCAELGTDPQVPVAIEFDSIPYPAVIAGDTMRDSMGVVARLGGVAYNLNGDVLPGEPVLGLREPRGGGGGDLADHLVPAEQNGDRRAGLRADRKRRRRGLALDRARRLVHAARTHLVAHLARRFVQVEQLEAAEQIRERGGALRRFARDLLERAHRGFELAVARQQAAQREAVIAVLGGASNGGLES